MAFAGIKMINPGDELSMSVLNSSKYIQTFLRHFKHTNIETFTFIILLVGLPCRDCTLLGSSLVVLSYSFTVSSIICTVYSYQCKWFLWSAYRPNERFGSLEWPLSEILFASKLLHRPQYFYDPTILVISVWLGMLHRQVDITIYTITTTITIWQFLFKLF